MSTFPIQDVKRRGISVVDEALAKGPVHIIKNNKPTYVILSEEDYQQMLNELCEARVTASEADIAAGRVSKGTAAELMADILKTD